MTSKSQVHQQQFAAGQDKVTPWFALCGIVGPIAFVLAFTAAGLLRPGYSPIHDPISDLGVGPNWWLLDGASVLNGLLLTALVAAFFQRMRTVLREPSRWLSSVLLALPPLGFAIAGIFTEDPSTLTVHWLVGANLAFLGPVVAFAVIGLLLRHNSLWRTWGRYSLVASLVTLALVALMFWVFTPGSPLAEARLGGLMERVVVIEVLAWYIALGWQLLREGSGIASATPVSGRGA